MDRICVYCGSNPGGRDDYRVAAEELAGVLVEQGIELVYGGASKGTMGILASEVLRQGGRAIGVLPKSLEGKEIAHPDLSELHVVETMHERKTLMASLSDAFVALPGGFGTLEELIEILTWGQLQFHDKPVGIINVRGYFDALLAYLDHAEQEGFLRPENRGMLLNAASAAELLQLFRSYSAPRVQKWL